MYDIYIYVDCFMNTSYVFKNNTVFDPTLNQTLNQITHIQGYIRSNCSININFEAEINIDVSDTLK
jgi:hypothetical protein